MRERIQKKKPATPPATTNRYEDFIYELYQITRQQPGNWPMVELFLDKNDSGGKNG